MGWKDAGRATVRRVGFVVHRLPGNGFDAMEDALRLLDRSGCQPRVVIVAAFLDARGFALCDFAALASRARDLRLRIGDAIFIRRDSRLAKDVSWD